MKNSKFKTTSFFAAAKLIIISTFFLATPLTGLCDAIPGDAHVSKYAPLLAGKRVALVVNQTAVIGNKSLVDTLLALKINIRKIFAPEHGFRGDAEAGANVTDATDKKTGVSVVSLYGKHFKPSKIDMADIDVVVYDIQDVGVRFFTYISTLHYVMEACAENKKELIVLDRPNPNGFYVDGPVLEKSFSSFVGMDPIPIVYGMTCGEYAQMLNGEGWLANAEKCDLQVIKAENYTHKSQDRIPIPPSPNLPTMAAIYLYPSLGLFEGTNVSVGRGTNMPFEVVGEPDFKENDTEFTPHSIPGKAENPMYKDQLCKGIYLSRFANDYIKNSGQLYLFWLTGFYKNASEKSKFFTPFFDKLAGTDQLRKQIEQGMTPEDIRKSWKPALEAFKKIRVKYLIYVDF